MAKVSGVPTVPASDRRQDLWRHLEDLRSNSYEGAGDRTDRMTLFQRAVELMDPIVRSVLDEANATFLDGTGAIEQRAVTVEASGDALAAWELSWPEQRAAKNVRSGGGVGPVQVVALFAAGFTHPHLRGSSAGNWPMQVVNEADAERQEPIVRAIVEAELHERVFEGTWHIVPSFVRTGSGSGAGEG